MRPPTSPSSATEANRYAYAGNDPVNKIHKAYCGPPPSGGRPSRDGPDEGNDDDDWNWPDKVVIGGLAGLAAGMAAILAALGEFLLPPPPPACV